MAGDHLRRCAARRCRPDRVRAPPQARVPQHPRLVVRRVRDHTGAADGAARGRRVAALRLRPRGHAECRLPTAAAVPPPLGVQQQRDAARVPAGGCVREALLADVGRAVSRARREHRTTSLAPPLGPLRLGNAGRVARARHQHLHRPQMWVADSRNGRRDRRLRATER